MARGRQTKAVHWIQADEGDYPMSRSAYEVDSILRQSFGAEPMEVPQERKRDRAPRPRQVITEADIRSALAQLQRARRAQLQADEPQP